MMDLITSVVPWAKNDACSVNHHTKNYLNSLERVRILIFYRKEPKKQLRTRDRIQSRSPGSSEIDTVTKHIRS